jgi:hypothetical protein
MKTTVSIYDFRDQFHQCGRGDQFSYDGLRVLFEFLEEYEDSTGSEIELDVPELCCEYSEDTPKEIAENYGYTFDEDENEDEDTRHNAIIQFLNDRTTVCGVTKDGFIVYQAF